MKEARIGILTIDHPRFNEFVERLEGSEGCNFREKNGKAIWDCGGGTDKSKAKEILISMGNINVEATLAYFEEHCGFCDCEILFNVASHI